MYSKNVFFPDFRIFPKILTMTSPHKALAWPDLGFCQCPGVPVWCPGVPVWCPSVLVWCAAWVSPKVPEINKTRDRKSKKSRPAKNQFPHSILGAKTTLKNVQKDYQKLDRLLMLSRGLAQVPRRHENLSVPEGGGPECPGPRSTFRC